MNYSTVYTSMMQHGMTKQAGFNMSALFRVARMRAGKGFDKAVKTVKANLLPTGTNAGDEYQAALKAIQEWQQAQIMRAGIMANKVPPSIKK